MMIAHIKYTHTHSVLMTIFHVIDVNLG